MKFGALKISLLIGTAFLLPLSPMDAAAKQPIENTAQSEAGGQAENSAKIVNAWGHKSPDLKPDAAIRYGVMENGIKYALRRNVKPEQAIAVRMQIATGSLAEADNERGLAHFLEHMAFNGSKNIAEGEMTKILERKGLAFGADTNASTGFEKTTYKLNLPQNDEDMIDTALFIMRETASELTISDEAVERERGVVLSEKQTRNSAGLRRIENLIQFALPETPYGQRLPIGTEEVLKTAPAARLKDFYRRYYRPEYTIMVISGDFDVDAMEAKLKSTFADWKGAGEAGKPIDRGTVSPAEKLQIGSFADPASSTMVEMMHIAPLAKVTDSVAHRQERLKKSVAASIISKRLEQLSLEKKPKIRGGYISFSPLFDAFDQASITINGNDGDWRGALAVGEQTLRQAAKYGVMQAEIDEQMANLETSFRNEARQSSNRKSSLLAGQILSVVDSEKIIITPREQLALFEASKPHLTVKSINAVLRNAFASQPQKIHISAKSPIKNADKKIRKILRKSSKVAISAPIEAVVKPFAYDSFGKAGKVAEDKRIEDLGIRTIKFANNVRLNIKKTDFEKDKIYYSLRFGSGELSVPQGKPAIDLFMREMSPVAGLKEHSYAELQRILAGHMVKYGLSYNSDSFGYRGATVPKDGALQMKLLAATVTDGGYRKEADSVWQNAVQSFGPQLDAQPMAVARYAVPRILVNGDTRFGIANVEELSARNIDEVKQLLSSQITDTPIDIAIVGDVDEKAAIKWVADSFGALPKRALVNPKHMEARKLSFTQQKGPIVLPHKGKEDQGAIISYWPTDDNKDQKSAIVRILASEIFASLLLDEVREKLGATYSPRSNSFSSDTYTGYGHFSTSIVAEPAKMDMVMQAIKDITKSMRETPVSADNILRARKPLMEQLEKSERENAAWLELVNHAQSHPEKLDRRRARIALLQAVTATDIQREAQKYLTDKAQISFKIVPESLKN